MLQARRGWQIWKEQGTRILLRKIGRRARATLWPSQPIPPARDLRATVDRLPRMWTVGKGNVLYFSGSCFHPEARIHRLEILANGVAVPVNVSMLKRLEIFQANYPDLDPRGHSLYSGFVAMVPIAASRGLTSIHLAIRAHLRNGTVCMKALGDIAVQPPARPQPLKAPGDSDRTPTIAICMTTYNPTPELFARQIESIRKQTNQDWLCIINDDGSDPKVFDEIVRQVRNDPRFLLFQNSARLGFYHNFEKCLSRVLPGIPFVALSDHDDCWRPDKLDTLLAEFDDETTLVYSDMNIVDRHGQQLAATYWTNRSNNYTNLASQFLANSISGAAAMFRRSLLDSLLPFPDPIGAPFHDHWIGCTALALGKVKFVDRPLYNYVQHGGNVIGHFVPARKLGLGKVVGLLKALWPLTLKRTIRESLTNSRAIYFQAVHRIQHLALVLQLRCPTDLPAAKRRTLHRLARLDSSLFRSMSWLTIRSLGSPRRKSVTMGAENCLLKGLGWRSILGFLSAMRSRGLNASPAKASRVAASAPRAQDSGPRASTDALTTGLERVDIIEQKIAPLSVLVAPGAPRRVNLLIPTIDFRYVFGGYITKFNLARCLAEQGHKVRIIIVDYCDYQPGWWKQQLLAYPGLETLLDCVDICYAYDRSKTIEFHPHDGLIATTWWTAHIAHQAVRALNQSRFVYLIQEFEPFTFPMGTFAALADETYTFPHHAVFSTEFLRDYFRQTSLGVFAEGREAGERNSISFDNTITAVGPITVQDLAGRSPKKLLYYARPEHHASRNMFETGIAALKRAAQTGLFSKDWELYGIGTVETSAAIALGNGATMQLLPRQSQDTYREVLRGHDLGLSLMYTPHPSLVPIEMASAGMWTVTNSCLNKTARLMKALSSNLIAVDPTIEAVHQGLKYAVENIENYEERVRGAAVKWSLSWEQAFNPDVMARIQEFLDAGSQPDTIARHSQAA